MTDDDAGGGQTGHSGQSAEVDIHTAVSRARSRAGSVSFPERNADPDLVSPALFGPAPPHQVGQKSRLPGIFLERSLSV